jgi:hypothetical protein
MIVQTIIIVLRLIRESATEMIGHDHPVSGRKKRYQATIIKRPGGISMHHDNHRTAPLIDIMQPV